MKPKPLLQAHSFLSTLVTSKLIATLKWLPFAFNSILLIETEDSVPIELSQRYKKPNILSLSLAKLTHTSFPIRNNHFDLIIANVSTCSEETFNAFLVEASKGLTSQGILLFATFDHASHPLVQKYAKHLAKDRVLDERYCIEQLQTAQLFSFIVFKEHVILVDEDAFIDCHLFLASSEQTIGELQHLKEIESAEDVYLIENNEEKFNVAQPQGEPSTDASYDLENEMGEVSGEVIERSESQPEAATSVTGGEQPSPLESLAVQLIGEEEDILTNDIQDPEDVTEMATEGEHEIIADRDYILEPALAVDDGEGLEVPEQTESKSEETARETVENVVIEADEASLVPDSVSEEMEEEQADEFSDEEEEEGEAELDQEGEAEQGSDGEVEEKPDEPTHETEEDVTSSFRRSGFG